MNGIQKYSVLIVGLFFLACNGTSSEEHPPVLDNTTVEKVNSTESKTIKPSSKNFPLPDWPMIPKKEKGKLYPYDEAPKDKSLVAFRQAMYNAVQRKDVDFLLSKVTDNISYSFGAEGGKEGFVREWNLDNNPEFTGLWETMEKCLELGGGFFEDDPNFFYAPFVFLSDELEDPFENGVIIGDNVRLRLEPTSKSQIVGSLSWDIYRQVMISGDFEVEEINGETHPWIPIETDNKEKGFVFGKYVRPPVDYRIGFSKNKEGEWMMHAFVAGD